MIKDYVLKHVLRKLSDMDQAFYEIDPETGYGVEFQDMVEDLSLMATNPQVRDQVIKLLAKLPDDFELVAILTGYFYDEGTEGTQLFFAGKKTQERVWANIDARERAGVARHTEMFIVDSMNNPKEYRIFMVSYF